MRATICITRTCGRHCSTRAPRQSVQTKEKKYSGRKGVEFRKKGWSGKNARHWPLAAGGGREQRISRLVSWVEAGGSLQGKRLRRKQPLFARRVAPAAALMGARPSHEQHPLPKRGNGPRRQRLRSVRKPAMLAMTMAWRRVRKGRENRRASPRHAGRVAQPLLHHRRLHLMLLECALSCSQGWAGKMGMSVPF